MLWDGGVLEGVEALGEVVDLLAKEGEFGFELGYTVGCLAAGWCGMARGGCGEVDVAQEMGEASLAGTGVRGELEGEWGGAARVAFGFGGGAGGQAVQGGLDGGEVIEGEEAVGAGAEFAWSLRAAEEEEAEQGGLIAAEVEDGAGTVLVLGDACVVHGGDERESFEHVEGGADVAFGEVEDGIAAGALVAGVDEGVEREGVLLGRGDLLLDEGAEDAEADGIERIAEGGGVGGGAGHMGRVIMELVVMGRG